MVSTTSDENGSNDTAKSERKRYYLSSGAAGSRSVWTPIACRYHTSGKTTRKTQREVIAMLETETPHKETLSPFAPLPAIGQRTSRLWEDKLAKHDLGARLKSLSDIKLNSLEARKLSAPNYYVLSLRSGAEAAARLEGSALNELKVPKSKASPEKPARGEVPALLRDSRAKKLIRQSTHDFLSPPVPGAAKRGVKQITRPPVESDFNYFSRNADPHHATRRGDTNNPTHADHSATHSKDNVMNNNNPNAPALDTSCARLLLGQNLFEKREKLLIRRRRESFSDVLDEVALKEGMSEGHLEEIKFFSSSEDDSDSEQPKMKKLIENFDGLKMARRYRAHIKKDNNWF